MKQLFYILAIIVSGLIFHACSKEKAPKQPITTTITETISFSQKIQPLIQQNCATSGCHDAGTAENGYNLSNYAGISNNAEDMLYSMRGQNGFTPMPFGGPMLENMLIDQFQAWIAQGKLEN